MSGVRAGRRPALAEDRLPRREGTRVEVHGLQIRAVDEDPGLAARRSHRAVPDDLGAAERERRGGACLRVVLGGVAGVPGRAGRPPRAAVGDLRARLGVAMGCSSRRPRPLGLAPSPWRRRLRGRRGRRRGGRAPVDRHDPADVARRVGRPAGGLARPGQPPVGDAAPAVEAAVQAAELAGRHDLLVGRGRLRAGAPEVAQRPRRPVRRHDLVLAVRAGRGVPRVVVAVGFDLAHGVHEARQAGGIGGQGCRRGEDSDEDDRREGRDEDRLEAA